MREPRRRGREARVTGAILLAAFAGLCTISWLKTPVRGRIISGADHVLVDKSDHRLTLLKDGAVVRTYSVALGRGGPGDKSREGDNRVPEGVYRIAGRNPDSAYHLALRIDYPTADQSRRARAQGVDPGGDIMIHGIRNGLGWIGSLHRLLDWTRGCIAVTDGEIEEIWRLVPDGTSIEIRA